MVFLACDTAYAALPLLHLILKLERKTVKPVNSWV